MPPPVVALRLPSSVANNQYPVSPTYYHTAAKELRRNFCICVLVWQVVIKPAKALFAEIGVSRAKKLGTSCHRSILEVHQWRA